jgi:hypothetical protein
MCHCEPIPIVGARYHLAQKGEATLRPYKKCGNLVNSICDFRFSIGITRRG